MDELKDCVLSVIADYNHIDKNLVGEVYDECSYTYLTKAIELLFKNEEFYTERAKIIRKYL